MNSSTRDIVARFAGISGGTLEKIEAVVQATEDDPDWFAHLKEKIDGSKERDSGRK